MSCSSIRRSNEALASRSSSQLAALKLATRTIVMTTAIDSAELRTALLRGARGILLKHCAGDLLLKCVRQVMRGEYLDRPGQRRGSGGCAARTRQG